MLQDKKLRVQEEQKLTKTLIAEGRGSLDAATAGANAAQKAVAVSHGSAQPQHSFQRRCTHFTHASYPLLTRGTYVHDINFSLQQLERHRDELLLWTAKIRRHVDDLVMQMSKRRALDLVYRTEDHAAELQRLAGALDR